MKKNRDKNQVRKALEEKLDNPKTHTLAFDFESGDLVVKPAGEEALKDEIVVDQIYKDGFFL